MPSIIQDHSVGPCAYSLPPLIPEGPSYSFGQAGRFYTPTNHPQIVYASLTPEKYREVSKERSSPEIRNKSQSMPPDLFSHRALFEISESPGPGHYNLSSTLYNKDFKLKGKYQDLKPLNNPGPGAYTPLAEPSKGFPFLTEPRFKPLSCTGGPSVLQVPKLSSGPSYSFGLRPKSAGARANVFPYLSPGPGAYDLPPVSEPAKISIKSRVKSLEPFNTPGPGSYTLLESKSSKGFTHGLPLTTKDSTWSPGPAAYNLESRPSGPAFSMGMRFPSKSEADNRDLTDPVSSFNGRAAILVGKPTENQGSSLVGPGTYSPKQVVRVFGFSQDRSSREQKIEISPGPCDYSKETKPEGPRYSLAGRLTPPKNEVSPGPGHYELPQERIRSPAIRGKPHIEYDNKVPGPGAYSPHTPYTALSFSSSKDCRFKEIEVTPGPSDFHSDLAPQGPRYSFTGRARSPKSSENQALASPGPGTYDLPSTISNISARLFGKPSEPEPKQAPGPGAYIHRELDLPSNKGFSLGKGSRHDPTSTHRNTPGPGAYEAARAKSLGYSFPKEPRQEKRLEEVPGPGTYKWEPLDKNLHISLGGKRKEETPNKTPVSSI